MTVDDYTRWKTIFTEDDYTFEQAFHNMYVPDFISLLFNESLTTSGDLATFITAVNTELGRRQNEFILNNLRSEGILSLLVAGKDAADGSPLLTETGDGAVGRLITSLETIFDNDRTKFLTTATLQNLHEIDGWNLEQDTSERKWYQPTTLQWDESPATLNSANNSYTNPSTGRLIPQQNPGWRITDSGTAATYKTVASILEASEQMPSGYKCLFSSWEQDPLFAYQKLEISTGGDNLFKLDYDGNVTGDIDASLPAIGNNDAGIPNADLRKDIQDKLDAMVIAEGLSVQFAVFGTSTTIKTYNIVILDIANAQKSYIETPSVTLDTSMNFFAETIYGDLLTKSGAGGAGVTASHKCDNYFYDFLGTDGNVQKDGSGKAIRTIKNTNIKAYTASFVTEWAQAYKDAGGELDYFLLNSKADVEFSDLRSDWYYGGSATGTTDRNENREECFKELSTTECGFDDLDAKLPTSVSDDFKDGSAYAWTGALGKMVEIHWTKAVLDDLHLELVAVIVNAIRTVFPNAIFGDTQGFTRSLRRPTAEQEEQPLWPIGNITGSGNGISQCHNFMGLLKRFQDIEATEDPFIPAKASKLTSKPCSDLRIKTIERAAGGEVTVTFFDEADRAGDSDKGNDQYANDFIVGDLVVPFASEAAWETNDADELGGFLPHDVGVNDVFNGFPITEVTSTTQIKYQDTDTNIEAARTIKFTAGSSALKGGFIQLAGEDGGWLAFLSDMSILRSGFACSNYPISAWIYWWGGNAAFDSLWNKAPYCKTKFREEFIFHWALHNPRFLCFTVAGGVTTATNTFYSDPSYQYSYEVADENKINAALIELDSVLPYQNENIRATSLNFGFIDLQDDEYVISAARLPNRQVLFRVTFKPGYSFVGYGEGYAIFQTKNGTEVRVPGTIQELDSQFTGYGYWVLGSNEPTTTLKMGLYGTLDAQYRVTNEEINPTEIKGDIRYSLKQELTNGTGLDKVDLLYYQNHLKCLKPLSDSISLFGKYFLNQ